MISRMKFTNPGVVRLAVLLLGDASVAQIPEPLTPRALPKLTIQHLKGKSRIEIDGKLFTEYIYEGWANPILYPVHGAQGIAMTRNFPMKKGVKGEATDHKHHRSLWFTHGEINGHDFWAGEGRIVQTSSTASQGDNVVIIIAENDYVVGKKRICRDKRTIAFHAQPEGRFIDYEVVLIASEGDLVFGDTKEGSMALRITPALRLKGRVAKGHIRNSEGIKDRKAWGKRAKWVDYYGPVEGKTVGVAIFDHPDNHGHPCRWHARGYGLVAANPWGIHHFEGAPKGTGEMTLKKGKVLRLRYRFFFHSGSTEDARVAQQFAKFAKLKAARDKR
jgi:Family of unknown function (DUF6807)